MNNLRLSAFIVLAGICIFAMTFAPPLGLNIGNMAPELTYTSPEGKEIALSSFRGSSFNNGDGFTTDNYLIDGNGVIIAKKLRGDKLHAKLSELQK